MKTVFTVLFTLVLIGCGGAAPQKKPDTSGLSEGQRSALNTWDQSSATFSQMLRDGQNPGDAFTFLRQRLSQLRNEFVLDGNGTGIRNEPIFWQHVMYNASNVYNQLLPYIKTLPIEQQARVLASAMKAYRSSSGQIGLPGANNMIQSGLAQGQNYFQGMGMGNQLIF